MFLNVRLLLILYSFLIAGFMLFRSVLAVRFFSQYAHEPLHHGFTACLMALRFDLMISGYILSSRYTHKKGHDLVSQAFFEQKQTFPKTP